jgi:hypothetical protein
MIITASRQTPPLYLSQSSKQVDIEEEVRGVLTASAIKQAELNYSTTPSHAF